MCFSAEASFGTAIIVSTIGVISLKKAENTSYRYLAMVPILFGIQQFIEGVIWLSFDGNHPNILSVSTYGFILFAWIVWPVFIPFSIWKIEEDPKRKKILLYIMLVGTAIIIRLIYVMITRDIQANIADCSIMYNYGPVYSFGWIFTVLYLITSALPTIISSVKKLWSFGVIITLMYFITKVYYSKYLISVWCFFIAIGSMIILWVIIENNPKKDKSNTGIK